MENGDETASNQSAPLTEVQRAAAFSSQNRVDRAAALRSGRTPVPPKFIAWMLVVFAVLGLGGAVIEHFYGNVGLPTSKAFKVKIPRSALTPTGSPSSMSLDDFIGLRQISNAAAPGFTLRDQFGKKWSLTSAKGDAIVLTFMNSICNDICPVVGAEIKQAQVLLGSKASKIDFVIVNSDPRSLAPNPSPPALSVPKLLTAPHVYFLTSSLNALVATWTNYGLKVSVGAKTDQVSHNNLMYFIDPSGHLAGVATPFAIESSAGAFSLNAAEVNRFAQGIALTAGSLVR